MDGVGNKIFENMLWSLPLSGCHFRSKPRQQRLLAGVELAALTAGRWPDICPRCLLLLQLEDDPIFAGEVFFRHVFLKGWSHRLLNRRCTCTCTSASEAASATASASASASASSWAFWTWTPWRITSMSDHQHNRFTIRLRISIRIINITRSSLSTSTNAIPQSINSNQQQNKPAEQQTGQPNNHNRQANKESTP